MNSLVPGSVISHYQIKELIARGGMGEVYKAVDTQLRRTVAIKIPSEAIVENRKAFHDYFVEERFEAGLVLEGWEVKAVRAGRAQIGDAYVIVDRGALWLLGGQL